jgi:agmatine deiminase
MNMPAEWEPHTRCHMGWPGRDHVPTRLIGESRDAVAEIAGTIARYEPVLMLAHPGFGRQAAAACGPGVEVMEVPLGTSWVRDANPLFAIRDGRELVAVDFAFNSWGSTLPPYKGSIGQRVCRLLGIPLEQVPLVLEGGAIAVDGAGTLVALEAGIVEPDRNPEATREDFERAFRDYLGITRTVWLPEGLPDDATGGHADNVVAFVAPGRVLCQRHTKNQRILEDAGLEVIPFDLPTTPVRYLNFYVGNGCVIVPTAGTADDAEALRRIGEQFPDREVLGVSGLSLMNGNGGVHCVTQQEPRVPATPSPPRGSPDRSRAAMDTRGRAPRRRAPPGFAAPAARTRPR